MWLAAELPTDNSTLMCGMCDNWVFMPRLMSALARLGHQAAHKPQEARLQLSFLPPAHVRTLSRNW